MASTKSKETQLLEDYLNAARTGDAAEVARCMKAGVEVYRCNPANGWNAMHYALQGNHPEVVRTLVKNGFDANRGADDENRAPILHFGLQTQNKDAIDALIAAGADINRRNAGNKSLLVFCLEHDEHFGIRYLLNAGAEPTQALNYLGGKSDFKWSGGTPNGETIECFNTALHARRQYEGEICRDTVDAGTAAPVAPLKPLRLKLPFAKFCAAVVGEQPAEMQGPVVLQPLRTKNRRGFQ